MIFDPDKRIVPANKQEAKADIGKPRPSLVPPEIVWAIAHIRGYGNQKYGDPDNWRTVEWERYLDALDRHVLLFNQDPFGIDEESGFPHLWHVACNVAFLCSMLDDDLKENMEVFKHMEGDYKEVYFNEYCNKCVFEKTPEEDNPCNECLTNKKAIDSHKPLKFVAKESVK